MNIYCLLLQMGKISTQISMKYVQNTLTGYWESEIKNMLKCALIS